MRFRSGLPSAIIITLSWVLACLAWQSQPLADSRPNLPGRGDPNTADQSFAVDQRGYPPQRASGGQHEQPEESSQQRQAPDLPHYPYSKYHNPFFDGNPAPNLVADALERLLSFPAALVDRFSNYADRNSFPAAPAAHGQAPPAASPRPAGSR
jgi:hypothetical protein